ncbi:hypothetical protein CC86DRAFT_250740, partial [Ophiobolus disseminans]
MAGTWGYDRLPTLHESRDQDITDANDEYHDTRALLPPQDSQIPLRPLSFSAYSPAEPPPSFPQYTSADQNDGADRSSVKSFETFESSATGSSTKKLKNLFRRRPLPRYLRGSIRRHAAADIEPARVGRGIWQDQLLSDRSFRTMAAMMSTLAIGMIIMIACNSRHIMNRANTHTTSVGGKTESCKRVTYTNTALLLLINVCATMVLGMSNTYQQIVTSLKISDLKYALSKFGDSRVGTNSPFNIQYHKEKGRKRAWASWFLLILTSMPVHFLANSLIGPSYTQELPQIVEWRPLATVKYDSVTYADREGGFSVTDSVSFPCWSALRYGSGTPHYPRRTDVLMRDDGVFGGTQKKFDTSWKRMVVHYLERNCSSFRETAKTNGDIEDLESRTLVMPRNFYSWKYQEGGCVMGTHVMCTLHEPMSSKCRLNVRMSAAFVLMGCLVIKAVY